MATKKHALLFLATYLLSEDALWELKCRRVQKKRKHRVWVRDFIRERLDDPSNTAYKLQLQSSVVSTGLNNTAGTITGNIKLILIL